MQTRREMLKSSAGVAAMLASMGLLPNVAHAAYPQAAFDAKTMADLMKALGASMPTESPDVTVTGPDIAENGAVVPVGASTKLPGVKKLLILVEKNPAMMSAMFDVSDAVMPDFKTRVKMGQTSDVYALVKVGGQFLMTKKEIKVTLGGCGG